MDNQQFQSAVLEKLEQLTARMDGMDSRLNSIETNMATKDEFAEIEANMATKDEFAKIEANMATKDEFAKIEANMATKDEFAKIEANMATKDEFAKIEANMATKDELARIKEIVVRIENDHGLKLGGLFDGYTLNAEKLDRIEKIVAEHEKTLLTKVK